MSDGNSMPTEQSSVHIAEHVTYHLVPEEVWDQQKFERSYAPERFDDEGFIHCTDTLEELIAVGNRYYRDDPRTFLVLAIDCEQVEAAVIYEDEQRQFPHIYGRLNAEAVLSAQPVERALDGTFLTMG